jgi:large subunit ribosomal protein L6
MSKVGRQAINIDGVQVDIKGNEVHYKGPKASGVYQLPEFFDAEVADQKLQVKPTRQTRKTKMMWGLHRALLANKIQGAREEFERPVTITGLGYKAVQTGKDLTFALGYSHKIPFELPEGVTVTMDKSGQKLVFKSSDKELLGKVCGMIRSLRPPEPYKGTGIKVANETIIRKAGKAKS